MTKKLEWEEKYSVGVELIDNQHKKMFATINELIELLAGMPTKAQIDAIVKALVEYKQFHFATEEKYFEEFDYEGKDDHVAKHKIFSEKLEELMEGGGSDFASLAYALVDFLEDWLLDHLMVVDQKYVSCFREHGLK